jgi:hypothetical protein
MAMDARSGKMEPSMKATGSSTRRVAGASSGTLMATFSRENGSMIKLMDMEFTFIKMALNTRATGKTIFSMVTEKKYGQIAQNMKAIIKRVKSMVEDSIYGKTGQCTTVTGTRTELKDMANTNGKMDVNT